MNKLITLSLSIALIAGFVSCSKVNPNKTGTNPLVTNPIEPLNPSDPLYAVGRVPLSFTKKAILEELTGEWCANCPDGATKMHELIAAYPDKVYGVAFHASGNDPFEVTGAQDALLLNIFPAGSPSTIGFPSASVNRKETVSLPDYLGGSFDFRESWASQMAPVLKQTAKCGLSMVASEENDLVNLDVFVGYNSVIDGGSYFLTVYLIEDNIPESAPGAQQGALGTATNPYVHQHVLRKIITTNAYGDAISLNSKDYYTKKSYSVNIAGLYRKKDNVKIVAIVNKSASMAKDLDVLNAQQVALDETKKWD